MQAIKFSYASQLNLIHRAMKSKKHHDNNGVTKLFNVQYIHASTFFTKTTNHFTDFKGRFYICKCS